MLRRGSFLPLVVFLGLGLLTHLSEKIWPLRTYSKPKAWAVDTFGFALAAVVTVAFRILQNRAIDRLPTVFGLGWLGDVSQFVSLHVPWPVAFVVSVVVLDFLLYVGHRLLHTSFLWHTHAAHHSVEHLYWLGGNRSSPFHTAFQLTWGALLGVVWPINGGLTGFVAATILYTCIQHFNHANLRWRMAPLEWLFVVPRYHFVHHGADPKLNNSNFGFLFTVWDRMLGTYTNPDSVPKDFPLGLEYEVGFARLFLGLRPAQVLRPTETSGSVRST